MKKIFISNYRSWLKKIMHDDDWLHNCPWAIRRSGGLTPGIPWQNRQMPPLTWVRTHIPESGSWIG
jgi:hypothetical protein